MVFEIEKGRDDKSNREDPIILCFSVGENKSSCHPFPFILWLEKWPIEVVYR